MPLQHASSRQKRSCGVGLNSLEHRLYQPGPRPPCLITKPDPLSNQENAYSGKGEGDESQDGDDWIEAPPDGKYHEASCTENPQKKDRDTENNL